MKKKTKIAIVVAIIVIAIVLVAVYFATNKNKENNNGTENNTNNTTNSTRTATASTPLEELEKYNKIEDGTYTTYTTTDGVSFMYPSKWVKVGTDEAPAFMGADGKGASVNYATDTIGGEDSIVQDFDTYISFQKLYLVQKMTMLSDIDENIVNLNGRKTYILNYDTESEQDGKTIQLHVTQVAFEDNGSVKILTMAVLKDSYSSVQTIFDKITKSFMK